MVLAGLAFAEKSGFKDRTVDRFIRLDTLHRNPCCDPARAGRSWSVATMRKKGPQSDATRDAPPRASSRQIVLAARPGSRAICRWLLPRSSLEKTTARSAQSRYLPCLSIPAPKPRTAQCCSSSWSASSVAVPWPATCPDHRPARPALLSGHRLAQRPAPCGTARTDECSSARKTVRPVFHHDHVFRIDHFACPVPPGPDWYAGSASSRRFRQGGRAGHAAAA